MASSKKMESKTEVDNTTGTRKSKRETTKVSSRENTICHPFVFDTFHLWLEQSKTISREEMKIALTLSGDEMQTWLLKMFSHDFAHLLSYNSQQLVSCPFYWDGKILEFCLNDDNKQILEWHELIKRFIDATTQHNWQVDFGIRFMVFPILLQSGKNPVTHGNVLIIDMNKQTIERFDPIGYEGVATWNSDELDSQIRAFFHAVPLLSTFTFQPLSVSCPNIGKLRNGKYIFSGPQAKERVIPYWKNEPKGFCSSWSMMYVYLKLQYPDITQENVAKCIEQFTSKELRTIIRFFCYSVSLHLVPSVATLPPIDMVPLQVKLCLQGKCKKSK